jgi:hypothetical protein
VITQQQRDELRALATPQGYRITARGPQIWITSKCLTVQFSNDDAGYAVALSWLMASMEGRERAKEQEAEKATQA